MSIIQFYSNFRTTEGDLCNKLNLMFFNEWEGGGFAIGTLSALLDIVHEVGFATENHWKGGDGGRH